MYSQLVHIPHCFVYHYYNMFYDCRVFKCTDDIFWKLYKPLPGQDFVGTGYDRLTDESTVFPLTIPRYNYGQQCWRSPSGKKYRIADQYYINAHQTGYFFFILLRSRYSGHLFIIFFFFGNHNRCAHEGSYILLTQESFMRYNHEHDESRSFWAVKSKDTYEFQANIFKKKQTIVWNGTCVGLYDLSVSIIGPTLNPLFVSSKFSHMNT
jgi:hypothetical protein